MSRFDIQFIAKKKKTYAQRIARLEKSKLRLCLFYISYRILKRKNSKYDNKDWIYKYIQEYDPQNFVIDLSNYDINTTKKVLNELMVSFSTCLIYLFNGKIYYNEQHDLDNYIEIYKKLYRKELHAIAGALNENIVRYSRECHFVATDDNKFVVEDIGFSEGLIKLIDDKGLKDSDVYKKANIDKRLFSKIKNDKNYIPKKTTVLAFCVGLELDLDETRDLLNKAGYSLSSSILGDIIVEYYIKNNVFDIMTINEALLEYDQQILGSKYE